MKSSYKMSLKDKFSNKIEFQKYQDDLCERYRKSPTRISVRQLVKEENERGYSVYYSQVQGWLKKKGIKIHPVKWAKPKSQRVGKKFNLDIDILNNLKLFHKNKTGLGQCDVLELGVCLVLGIPTRNLILYLDEKRTVIFFSKNPTDFNAYTHENISPLELALIKEMVNGARLNGIDYIINRAKQLDLKFIGGNVRYEKEL